MNAVVENTHLHHLLIVGLDQNQLIVIDLYHLLILKIGMLLQQERLLVTEDPEVSLLLGLDPSRTQRKIVTDVMVSLVLLVSLKYLFGAGCESIIFLLALLLFPPIKYK